MDRVIAEIQLKDTETYVHVVMDNLTVTIKRTCEGAIVDIYNSHEAEADGYNESVASTFAGFQE